MGILGAVGSGMVMYGTMAHQENMAQLQSDLDVQRAQRIEEMRRQSADKERTDRASAINKEYDGMVGEAQAAKANELYGEGSNLKAEDLADEEKANLKLSEKEQLSARIKAGEKLGYDMSKERSALVHMEDSDARTADRNAVLEMNRQSRADRTNAMIENNKRTNSVREALAASRGGSSKGSKGDGGGKDKTLASIDSDLEKHYKNDLEITDEKGEKAWDNDTRLVARQVISDAVRAGYDQSQATFGVINQIRKLKTAYANDRDGYLKALSELTKKGRGGEKFAPKYGDDPDERSPASNEETRAAIDAAEGYAGPATNNSQRSPSPADGGDIGSNPRIELAPLRAKIWQLEKAVQQNVRGAAEKLAQAKAREKQLLDAIPDE